MSGIHSSRRVAVWLIVLVVAAWGTLSLEYGAAPSRGQTWLSVIIEHFGVDPLEMERTITVPLEDELGSLSTIARLQSYTDIGRSRVEVLLHSGADSDEAFLMVRDAAYRVHDRLPRSVQRPRIARSTQDAETALFIGVQDAGSSLSELRTFVEQEIEPQIKALPDSGEVIVIGGRVPEIHVSIDRDRSTTAGVVPTALAQRIQQAYVHGGLGSVTPDSRELLVSVDGRVPTPADLERLVIFDERQPIRIGALADVRIAYRDPETIGRFDASEQVGISVTLAGDGNAARLSADALRIVRGLQDQDVDATIIVDRGAEIVEELRLAALSFLTAFVTLFLPLLILLRSGRAAVFASLLLVPVLLITLGLLGWIGTTVDAALIAGLTIGLGLVLDPIITILLSRSAAESQLLTGPIVAGGLTTILALAPLTIALSQAPGSLQLAAGIAAAVAASVALALAGRVELSRLVVRKRRYRSFRVLTSAALLRPGSAILAWAVVLSAGVVAAIRLPLQVDTGLNEEAVLGRFELESGTAVEAVDREIGRFAADLLRQPSVAAVQTTARRDSGTFSVEAVDGYEHTVRADIMRISLDYPQAFVLLPSGVTDEQLSAEITILGPELAILEAVTRRTANLFAGRDWVSQLVLHFKAPPQELLVIPRHDRLAQAGTTPERLGRHLQRLVYGPVAIKWRNGDRDIDLRVLAPETRSFDQERLLGLTVPSRNGAQIRLSDVAELANSAATGRIQRTDRQRSLSFSVTTPVNDVRVLQQRIGEQLAAISLPAGYGWQPDPGLDQQLEQTRNGWIAVVMAVALIACVLIVQFESLLRAWSVVVAVPFTIAPALLALSLTGQGLSTPALMGMVIAAGISVNNVILILAQASTMQSLIKALKDRLPALAISTATTAVGALPLVLLSGSENLAAVGMVVLVSVISSLIFSLTAIPAVGQLTKRSTRRAHG